MKYSKYLKAAYSIEGITSAREKARVRSALYRLNPDWSKERLPSLAVAFAILSLCKPSSQIPGWIVGYQQDAVNLSDRIDTLIKESFGVPK
jgi:hypothetical protein